MKNILLILLTLLFISCNGSFCKEALSYSLIISSEKGHESIVNILLKHNADINVRSYEGCTALIIASQKGYEEIVNIY